MNPKISLYYPSHKFEDINWLKTAALYWDGIARIVTKDLDINDSNDVRRLNEELNFIKNISPSNEEIARTRLSVKHIAFSINGFNQNIVAKLNKVGKKMNLDIASVMEDRLYEKAMEPDFTYLSELAKEEDKKVFRRESTISLRFVLKHLLKRPLSQKERKEFNLLSYIYMSMLAHEIARNLSFYPTTNQINRHFVSENSIFLKLYENTPLNDINGNNKFIAEQLAFISLRRVLPKNIESIPIKKIVTFRNKYQADLNEYQKHIDRFIEKAKQAENLRSVDELQEYLVTIYDKNVQPQLVQIEKAFHDLDIDTTTSAFNIKFSKSNLLKAGVITAASAFNPLVAAATGTASVSFGLIPTLRKAQEKARKIIKDNPSSFLFLVKEEFNPITLTEKIAHGYRQFVYGI